MLKLIITEAVVSKGYNDDPAVRYFIVAIIIYIHWVDGSGPVMGRLSGFLLRGTLFPPPGTCCFLYAQRFPALRAERSGAPRKGSAAIGTKFHCDPLLIKLLFRPVGQLLAQGWTI